ncbi:hypothetical protein VNI00_016262 [Paramarasmius palmivorus]|uniref:Uncharacterized protein n=1 Tax=Paramarasmius palmivorus TaxID=297713 RepID=A0AAW0BES5_9AGAR
MSSSSLMSQCNASSTCGTIGPGCLSACVTAATTISTTLQASSNSSTSEITRAIETPAQAPSQSAQASQGNSQPINTALIHNDSPTTPSAGQAEQQEIETINVDGTLMVITSTIWRTGDSPYSTSTPTNLNMYTSVPFPSASVQVNSSTSNHGDISPTVAPDPSAINIRHNTRTGIITGALCGGIGFFLLVGLTGCILRNRRRLSRKKKWDSSRESDEISPYPLTLQPRSQSKKTEELTQSADSQGQSAESLVSELSRAIVDWLHISRHPRITHEQSELNEGPPPAYDNSV